MVSYALFSVCLVCSDGQCLEISAVDLSAAGFTFHMAGQDEVLLNHGIVCCHVHSRGLDSLEEVSFTDFTISCDDDVWRLETENPAYRQLAKALIRDVQEYTRYKNQESDSELTMRYTGHAVSSSFSAVDFVSWRRDRLSKMHADGEWLTVLAEIPEVSMALSSPPAYTGFLRTSAEDWWRQSLLTAGLGEHPLNARLPNAAVIGNMYCDHLMPDLQQTIQLIQKCRSENIRPIIALPPITEDRVDAVSDDLHGLSALCTDGKLEMVIGDMGIPLLLQELGLDCFTLTAGPLVIRRRKDPRIHWQQGDLRALRRTSANGTGFALYMKENGIDRLMWEACGYPIETSSGSVLQMPFYQMNTGTLCTLKAVCSHGHRGIQIAGEPCPGWCETNCFLYPDEMDMVGRGNTLFGLDTRVLSSAAYFRELTGNGVARLHIELL